MPFVSFINFFLDFIHFCRLPKISRTTENIYILYFTEYSVNIGCPKVPTYPVEILFFTKYSVKYWLPTYALWHPIFYRGFGKCWLPSISVPRLNVHGNVQFHVGDLGKAPQYLFYSCSSIDLMLNNVQGEEEVRRSDCTMCMHGTPQCMSTNECIHKISEARVL